MTEKLKFRQIHLDFHTSEAIEKIGDKFDKKKWQETLKKGHVNSVTTFATCHHGYSYYDTKIGVRHPGLKFDLLKAQYEASKEIGVNVPIYLTAGVHHLYGTMHPEWREITSEGCYMGWAQSPLNAAFSKLCFNSPYLDVLCSQIEEVVQLYPDCDGIFLDIINQRECCCVNCMKSMKEKGYDPTISDDRVAHAKEVLENYYKRTTAAAKKFDKNMKIFHNSGHIFRGQLDVLKYFSHLELESLPTGGWGYDHFPVSAKYCKNLDFDLVGMTGKFHTTWGEFGGFKHPNALRYECAAMLAFGSKCSVGDQLHPSGVLDESTYDLIGAAYSEVESKEPWCEDVTNVADIAILSSAGMLKKRDTMSDNGASRILLETHMLFDIIDMDMDFHKYKLLILPDDILICDKLQEKINAYIAQGGKVLFTGDSGLKLDKSDFAFDFGATFHGESDFILDYLVASDEYKPDFVSSPLIMYRSAYKIKADQNNSLGKVCNPYFDRTYEHFCSHQHAPYNLDDMDFDCGVINENVAYLAHRVFSIYGTTGAVAYKQYVMKVIKKLLNNEDIFAVNMPSSSRVSLMKQVAKDNYVVHLLHANVMLRSSNLDLSGGNIHTKGKPIEVIEDIIPINNVEVKIKLAEKIKNVILQPQGVEIAFEQINNELKFLVEKVECHQMVELKY